MPEIFEVLIFYQYLCGILSTIGPLPVFGLYADPTNMECQLYYRLLASTTGPIKLDRTHHFMRRGGKDSAKGSLCPPVSCIGDSDSFDLTDMVWKGVLFDPRHVILDLNGIWLKIHGLQHTSPQVLQKDKWERVSQVHKDVRGFKIGLALDLGSHILMFASQDLNFHVKWLQESPPTCLNPSEDWEAWVKYLLRWLDSESNSDDGGPATTKCRRQKNRDSMVCMVDFLRGSGSGTPLAGFGAYSSDEILFLAAISPFLRVRDALNCPSRLARFCEAIFHFVNPTIQIDQILKKSRSRDPVTINATLKERLQYSRGLHVHGADKTGVPAYIGAMFDANKAATIAGKETYDVFDPSLLPAMSQEGHFGHHIFGRTKWKDLTGRMAPTKDLLSLYFRKEVGFESYFGTEAETHLDLNAYLSINPGDPRNGRFISTHLYKFGKRGKAIWTPLLCPQDVWKHRAVVEKVGRKKHKHLVTTVKLGSAGWAVGPLDFCGVAHVIRLGKKQVKLAYCQADPGLSTKNQLLLRRSIDRRAEEKGPVNTKLRTRHRRQAQKLWLGVTHNQKKRVPFGKCEYRLRADASVVKSGQALIRPKRLRSGRL